MTQDEADKIAAVIGTADGGCGCCVDSLCELLNRAGLGFTFERIMDEPVEPPAWDRDNYHWNNALKVIASAGILGRSG